jgi:acyl carrier protein
MRSDELVTQAISHAIDEVNGMPGVPSRVGKSPDTVLIGENGNLDSLFFVAFITAVEEWIERSFNKSVAVLELFTEELENACTVGQLAQRVTELVDAR